jgi:hypothetical protein
MRVTKEILYSEERKRGRALGIMKEVAGQQKSMEEQRDQRRAEESQLHPWLPRLGRESQS